MATEEEKSEHVQAVYAELEKVYKDRTSGSVSFATKDGTASSAPPRKETSLDKLRRANRGTVGSRSAEPPLTDAERSGLSETEFAKLPAAKRLAFYNSAMAARRAA
jgi:hypothetical protein